MWRFYAEQGRKFPWRETDNEYEILVSELMLQQTQTERVLKKYSPFLEVFPDYGTLAEASTIKLLEMWSGLGYSRRALALRDIAARVYAMGGRLPSDEETLLSFPMIGPATAGSLRAFVFNIPSVFIETNIRRVFIYHFFRCSDAVSDSEILPLVSSTLDTGDPRNWYYALMDYGVFLKSRVPNPNRKSSHYRVQAPFEGSNRQLRGKVLRLLVSGRRCTYTELLEGTSAENLLLETCLEGLEKDGFIVCESPGTYSLKE
ncbi:MAG: A/G-specific adenine glycosylase [Spirochaetaceae bacterium]